MEFTFSVFILLLASLSLVLGQDAAFWNNQARDSIQKALERELNIGEAKNIIFFLGDGMSVPTVTAARIRQGQLKGETGEENILAWETFPHVGLIKTYNTDAQVPDSAGTATAFFSGIKTKSGVVGIDDRVEYADCESGVGGEVDSVLVNAHNIGKATGVISTARITHATPAATYAHVAKRGWEVDTEMIEDGEDGKGCKDIALQLIEDNSFIKVILGGGRRMFYNNTELDPEDPSDRGNRTDGRNLIEEWQEGKANAYYVWNKEQFDAIDEDTTDYLFGLFEDSHMRYASESEEGNDPSLASMTEKAIKMLQKEEKGFFLAVEGGRIDHAHHAGNAYNALGDAIAMSDAVAMALEMTSDSDTLIVVTADHAHTMSIGGYPDRGNKILGLAGYFGSDDLPFTTLGYLNGPGAEEVRQSYSDTGMRPNLTEIDTEDKDYLQQAIVPLSSESHGGDDVAIYATGPMAHLFHGVQEQSYIAHVMRNAGCYDETDTMNACLNLNSASSNIPSALRVSLMALLSAMITYFF
ncbi:alkaline phosphatase [Strongylocentrotus purpuratus]|uniref:Alkaline phosphatase n=1 Tax=Strongylocentrotus purpuratus TaxID=7668 RepID=A0A7M7SZG0_STRPU|nr:alkaline phosphatase [Strongylocentrotus purpuratus]